MPTLRWSLTLDGPVAIAKYGSITYTESFYQEVEEATGTTDTALAVGGVGTATALYFESDQALTLNLNSNTGTDISVLANKPVTLTGTSITALYISNASGSTANVKYLLTR